MLNTASTVILSVLKSTVFWDIMLCSRSKVNQRFVGTYCLHLQGWRISWAKYQHEIRWKAEQLARCNFEFYWRQEGNGRVELSSHWLACRTEWNCLAVTQCPNEPIGDKSRRLEWPWKGVVLLVWEKERKKCKHVVGRETVHKGEKRTEL
jgi:hypothetical protein